LRDKNYRHLLPEINYVQLFKSEEESGDGVTYYFIQNKRAKIFFMAFPDSATREVLEGCLIQKWSHQIFENDFFSNKGRNKHRR
jgi:hypothetical protein